MLRITVQDSPQASTLKLEGKLTGPWVKELEQSWITVTATVPDHPVVIDLSDVTFIDCAGKCLLAPGAEHRFRYGKRNNILFVPAKDRTKYLHD